MRTIIKGILIFIIGFALYFPFPVKAQLTTPPQDTTIITDELEEITVTAFRSPYNIFNTPAPVNLIQPIQLETGSSLTPVEALNQVPGVLMHHGTLNTNRLTIRGIGSRTPYATNKIKAYFGEIPLTTGDGETTLEDLENSAIQRIEIIKGPSSSLYGAGLAGVILFHPKTVVKDFVRNQTTIASFGTVKNSLSAGVGAKKLKVYALGSILTSNGFRENNQTNRANIILNSMYSFSEKSNLQLLLKATKMKGYIPSSLDYDTFQESPENAATNWKNIEGFEEYTSGQFGISYNRFTLNEGKISVVAFGSLKNLDELRPFNRLEESSEYVGVRAYIQKVISKKNTRLVFTTGAEMFRENYNWTTFDNNNAQILSDNKEKRQYENLFVQAETNFYDKIFISAGLNGNLTRFYYTDYYHANGDQSGRHNYKPVLSPRIGLNVVFSEQFSMFGNISHGFSTPTFEETLLPEGELNKEIKPESGWSFETGIRSQFSNRLQFTASYYTIYVNDLLVARRTGEDAYVGVNAGQSLHPGLETELTWNILNPGKYPSVSLSGGATFANYHFSDFVDSGIDYTGNLLPGTARETWMAAIHFTPFKNLKLHAWHRFTGEMPLDDANSGFSDPFGISNAEVRFNGERGKLNIELKGGVQNIFNIHYTSMIAVNAPSFGGKPPRYYYPGNPRNYYVSILIGLVGE
ncbi:MAG: TonB-dependent receptor [Bacteroidota bacterium]